MAFSPVLPNTPPAEVREIVTEMLRTARQHSHSYRTVQWLLTRALHWVIENAPGFIAGTARDEANMGHLQAAIFATARDIMPEHDVLLLRTYQSLLLEGSHVYVLPVYMDDWRDVVNRLNGLLHMKHLMDKWLIIRACRIFDVITANAHLIPPEQQHFIQTCIHKYKEYSETWPFFAEVYPQKVMTPIMWKRMQ